MRLADLTIDMLQRAVRLYIDAAYPDGRVPLHVAEQTRFDTSVSIDRLIHSMAFEHSFDETGNVEKYQLRLGNHMYPHMKLGIERCAGSDDFVFVVDTHDRHITIGPSPDESDGLADLLERNTKLKNQIEQAWRDAGLPTQSRRVTDQTSKPAGHIDKTVLIIDDDEAMAELQQVIVEQAGYTTLVSRSGHEALHLLRSGAHVDLCLLDMMMPRFSGPDVQREIKALGSCFPIVVVTAMPRDRVKDISVDAVITKPFQPDYLIDVIRGFIG